MPVNFTDEKRAELQRSVDAAIGAFEKDPGYMLDIASAAAKIMRSRAEKHERLHAPVSP